MPGQKWVEHSKLSPSKALEGGITCFQWCDAARMMMMMMMMMMLMMLMLMVLFCFHHCGDDTWKLHSLHTFCTAHCTHLTANYTEGPWYLKPSECLIVENNGFRFWCLCRKRGFPGMLD